MAALGGKGQIEVLIDNSRELYGKWGLGLTGEDSYTTQSARMLTTQVLLIPLA